MRPQQTKRSMAQTSISVLALRAGRMVTPVASLRTASLLVSLALKAARSAAVVQQ